MIGKGLMIYYDQYESIKALPNEEKGMLLDVLFKYLIDGVIPGDETPVSVSMAFNFMKVSIDRGLDKYSEIIQKRRDAANTRWGNANASTCINCNANDANDANNNNNNNINITSLKRVREKKVLFSPPSIGEVEAYINEKGYNVDAERFMNFYASNGWMVGRNKMKEWHAALATWDKRDNDNNQNGNYKETNRTAADRAREAAELIARNLAEDDAREPLPF